MKLEKLAKECGVKIVHCSKQDWGGSIGYHEEESPNVVICGFNSKREAYEHWLQVTFGNRAGAFVIKALGVM